MRALNNKGFLLVETLVVATFVLTVLVLLFVQFKNLVVNYNNSYNYNTVEGVYNLNSVKKYITHYENKDNQLKKQLLSKTENFLVVYNETCTNLNMGGIDFCNSIMSSGNFETVLYTNSNLTGLKTYLKTKSNKDINDAVGKTVITEEMRNFIKRIDSVDNKQRLIAKYKDGTFATITFGVNNEKIGTSTQNDAFNYTGGPQVFTAAKDGYYKIEAWGAQGGTATYGNNSLAGGKGAYTAGEIYLTKGEQLYIYVGGMGVSISGTSSAAVTNNGGNYNGGGQATFYAGNSTGGGGGGATDIRLTGGTWSDATSLRSRIIVAAGGGGSKVHANFPNYTGTGGAGGNLIGITGVSNSSTCYEYGTGGVQTSGGGTPICAVDGHESGVADGTFGYSSRSTGAITNLADTYSGGGGGYYGGASAWHGPAGGGSSYISGYAGVNSITSASSGTHTNQTKHYSGKYFINATMTSGANAGGNGKANIKYIGTSPTSGDSSKIKKVRYIKDCISGSTANNGNHWIEVQAINTGVNVAKGKTVTTDSGAINRGAEAVDGIIDQSTGSSGYAYNDVGSKCLNVDLGSEMNLEEISVWHYYLDGRAYYDNVTYTAGADKVYRVVRNVNAEAETVDGKKIKSGSTITGSNVGLFPSVTKGGTISLSKSQGVVGETITINTSPSSTFTYAGASIVCPTGTKTDTTAKTFAVPNCSGDVVVYPKWKKTDFVNFWVDTSPINSGWNGNLFDGCQMTIGGDNNRYYYYFSHGACASRGQMHSLATYKVDDYKNLRTIVWCSPSSTFYQGLISAPSNWLHGATYFQGKTVTGSGSSPEEMIYNITDIKGTYYLALQKVLTTGASGFCNVNKVMLEGDTFQYNHPY